MSSTFRPADSFDYVKAFCKNVPLESIGYQILDDVHKMLWMAAPWRWTLDAMPVVNLASNTQDYSVVVPANFLFLHEAYITDGNTVNGKPLAIVPALPSTVGVVGQPTHITLVGGNTYRVSPVPGTISGSTQAITALYKKTAPAITRSSQFTAGVQVFDDEWFWVFQEGVLWKAFMYAEDARAGNQRAAFLEAIEFMRQHEPLPLLKDLRPEVKR